MLCKAVSIGDDNGFNRRIAPTSHGISHQNDWLFWDLYRSNWIVQIDDIRRVGSRTEGLFPLDKFKIDSLHVIADTIRLGGHSPLRFQKLRFTLVGETTCCGGQ